VRMPAILVKLRRYIFTGLLVLVPIALTVFVLIWVSGILTDLLKKVPVPPWAQARPVVQQAAAFVVVMAVVTLVGLIARVSIGRKVIRWFEQIVDRIPLVNRTYKGVRQVSQIVLSRRSAIFREAVLIEYPRRGIWSVGFVTGGSSTDFEKSVDEELVHVFVATSPNPTSGMLLLVPRKEVIPMGCSVEDAMKLVISGGILLPGFPEPQDDL